MISIDTDRISAKYRVAAIDRVGHRLLVTDFRGTEQEQDLSEPTNCGGVGRIRHFRRGGTKRWPSNPLPIDPASRALRLPLVDGIRAQVFQNAVCNWRCWYCFVPFQLLAAHPKHSIWLTPEELIARYLSQPTPPQMIDLTGGQPDLTPEWVPWMMEALEAQGLSQSVYLWSDDNLSTDYLWTYLSDDERMRMATYRNYGRVCCFKGFDTESFTFNTAATPDCFDRQFVLMDRLLDLGIDIYAYATFTTPSPNGMEDAIQSFCDRLQHLDEYLPLRLVPLEVQVFTPVKRRLTPAMHSAMEYQYQAVELWQRELERRFSCQERSWNIADVPLRRRTRWDASQQTID
jgi:uncharacterized Fe-S cluster-containing radical SAM superfamily protein